MPFRRLIRRIDRVLVDDPWIKRAGGVGALAGLVTVVVKFVLPPIRHATTPEIAGLVIAVGLVAGVRERRREAVRGDGARHVVGGLRASINHWQGRQEQLDRLVEEVRGGRRLIFVHGRRGIGKTGLVAKGLSQLGQPGRPGRAAADVVDVVIVSGVTRTRDITLYRIYEGLAGLLGGDEQLQLLRRWPYGHDSALAVLLAKLGDRSIVIVLDNLEDIQDAGTGAIDDPDVEAFLVSVCALPRPRISVITTSVVQPRLDVGDRASLVCSLELRDGLDDEAAVALLRALDADNRAGLRDAPVEPLRRLAERVYGIPRGLELACEVLRDDHGLTQLDDLLEGGAEYQGILDGLVSRAFARLGALQRTVVEALALAGAPLPVAAVPLLVDAERAGEAKAVLRSLARGSMVSVEDGTMSIHPMDADYVLGAFVADVERRGQLHARLGEWYTTQQRDPVQWRGAEDADSVLMAYRHLWSAGRTVAAMATLTRPAEYLAWVGHAEELRRAAARAAPLADADLEFYIASCTGYAEGSSGSLVHALAHFERAAVAATSVEQRVEANYMQAFVLRNCNRPGEAIALLDQLNLQATPIPRMLRIRAGLELGLAACYAGDAERAALAGRELAQIVRDDDPPSARAMAADLDAAVHVIERRWDEAVSAAGTAASLYAASWSDAINAGYALNSLGVGLFRRGDPGAAIRSWEDAARRGEDLGNHRLRGFASLNLAWAFIGKRDWRAAGSAALIADASLSAARLPEAEAARRLAAALARRDERVGGGEFGYALRRAAEAQGLNPDLVSDAGGMVGAGFEPA